MSDTRDVTINDSSATVNSGVLYVVATPIGNLGDISQRAIEVLNSVSIVAAEDTRTARKLFSLLGINQSCMAYHEHNEEKQITAITDFLDRGESVALISDAGTPLISDPGYPLINALRQSDYIVVPIPGSSAIITALSVAGIATNRFTFEGFLPAKPKARQKQLHALAFEARTMVFYESPHRIEASVKDLRAVFGDERKATLCRELTKKFETIEHGSLDHLSEWIQQSTQQKGEFVLVVAGYGGNVAQDEQASLATLEVLMNYLGPSQAAAAAAQLTGQKKKFLYHAALELQDRQ